jgi:lipopolysaccharide/colanic/teichoic acid biosynthesis glycosyltransferase
MSESWIQSNASWRKLRNGECHVWPVLEEADQPRPTRLRRQPVIVSKPEYELVKRAIDICICVAALTVVAPVIGVAALVIWVSDPGPVFFVQQRTGRGGRRFPMYKLRTMVQNADELKADLLHLNQRTGPDFKLDDDPRITRFGQFLRRTSLDELPQIFNVLKGDMSLVGPRPTSFEVDTYSLWQTERLEITPGITGLWQVEARGDPDFAERVRLDIQYIENRSTIYDLSIMLRTVSSVLKGRGV